MIQSPWFLNLMLLPFAIRKFIWAMPMRGKVKNFYFEIVDYFDTIKNFIYSKIHAFIKIYFKSFLKNLFSPLEKPCEKNYYLIKLVLISFINLKKKSFHFMLFSICIHNSFSVASKGYWTLATIFFSSVAKQTKRYQVLLVCLRQSLVPLVPT